MAAAISVTRLLLTKLTQTTVPKALVNHQLNFYATAPATTNNFEFIKTHKAGAKNNVGVITLNRPNVLNALCDGLVKEMSEALKNFDNDEEIGAIVITGSGKAFAAGADIKEMKHWTYAQMADLKYLQHWDKVPGTVKPLIAAVNGIALGAGCELSMMCDIIYAADTARFGQPEILIGTIPGLGGTQRLTRIAGKSKAMEMALTGNQVPAHEAERMGLVSKVFPAAQVLEESIKLGEKISANSHLINALCKESVNVAYETTLIEGLHFEKRTFHGTFATKDRKEGMTAFVEKRPPNFTNE